MGKLCKNSIILIDKPPGFTSFDIVKKLRNYTNIKKIGHAGVLDKPASGLLVCATERATKLLSLFENGYKIYMAKIMFGTKTDTYDMSGDVIAKKDNVRVTKSMLNSVIHEFTGEIFQCAPPYSNIKINGKRLYKYAINKEKVNLPCRKVTIYGIKVDEAERNVATFSIRCSKGTYIRSLANDIGERLGVFGCVKSLRRIYSYPFDVKMASNIDNIECLSVENALDFLPALRIDKEFAINIANGVDFSRIFNCKKLRSGLYRVFADNIFAALIEKKENNKVIYKLIFPNE